LLILLWVIFVNFSFTAPATSSTNNLTQVMIVTVVKVLQNSCFLTSLVKTNSMERSLLENLIVIYILEWFPSYGVWEFITVFIRVCHLSISWAESVQLTPPSPAFCNYFNIIHICVYAYHFVCLCGSSKLCHTRLSSEVCVHFLSPPCMLCAIHPSFSLILNMIVIFEGKVPMMKFLLVNLSPASWQFLHLQIFCCTLSFSTFCVLVLKWAIKFYTHKNPCIEV
jgi:hypothetical protein